ncbi:unnamed protein product [Pleuronectes platessa]|uniref:Uncharacterized protein n=1 Tax=Pleuronectes platessa TaxID=8262 RepID=A0A9N7U8U6_PLEPL|nr:unnamed protein product [Pleuronectes platessa]
MKRNKKTEKIGEQETKGRSPQANHLNHLWQSRVYRKDSAAALEPALCSIFYFGGASDPTNTTSPTTTSSSTQNPSLFWQQLQLHAAPSPFMLGQPNPAPVSVSPKRASEPPAAYKPSAAIMEEGPHCVKDKSGVCHQWEITVIYEDLSLQRQVNMHFEEGGVGGGSVCNLTPILSS